MDTLTAVLHEAESRIKVKYCRNDQTSLDNSLKKAQSD